MSIHTTACRSAWLPVVLAVCLASSGACDERTPTTPTSQPGALEGRWSGSMIDRAAGTGAFEVVLTGSNELGTGTFSLTFADPSANVQGSVLARPRDAGIVDLTINLTSNARDCTGAPGLFYAARMTLSGNRMTGTYEPTIGCPLLRGGALELNRR
jgi:hypothetical protein